MGTCKNCKHGISSFWRSTRCIRFLKEPCYKNIQIKHAEDMNYLGKCLYFDQTKLNSFNKFIVTVKCFLMGNNHKISK